MKKQLFVILTLLFTICLYGQPSRWNTTKKGTWRFENHLPEKGFNLRNGALNKIDNIAFKKNILDLSEWFRQNHPMLKNPVGYDLRALTKWVWSDFTTKTESEYGIPASMGFLFELFDTDGEKWIVEPPQYNFEVNAVFGGISGFYFTPESVVDDGSRYDLSLSKKVEKALRDLTQYFHVFPLKQQPCPGVDIYEAYRDGWQQNGRQSIVVYNPERPPYWLPVTVQEMAEAHLAYYSLIQKTEIDRMIYEELKKEIADLSAEELSAPAHYGHDSHFVLKVNGKGIGLQIKRFNPAYWDQSLPVSAIQFMTFWSANLTGEEMADQQTRSYPNYPQLFVNQLQWEAISGLIQKK